MKYTLGQAAKATGKAKSTILRTLKSGQISANKSQDGSYAIDPSELHRVFPPLSRDTVLKNTLEQSAAPPSEHLETLKIRLEILESERQRERDQMQATIDDLRSRLDRSEARVTALLNAPVKERRRWWQR